MFIFYGIPILFKLGNPYVEIGCMASILLDYTYITSNLLLIAIGFDRLFLVTFSYNKYVAYQTTRRVKVSIVICYVVGLVSAVIEMSSWNYAKRNNQIAANIDFNQYCLFAPRRMRYFGLYISLAFYCTPLILIAILSTLFFIRLQKTIKKKRQIGISATEMSAGPSNNKPGTEPDETSDGAVIRKRYIKPAITLAALVSAMAISMLPYCIYLIVVFFNPRLSDPDLISIMWFIGQLNPALDPVFYAATQKAVREFYQKKLLKFFRCFQH